MTPAVATVIGAALSFVLGVAGLYVQNRKVHRDNRKDQQETASKVSDLIDTVLDMRTDVREVKAEVRDVKDEVRSHGDRLRNLEHWNAVQDATDAVVADNARKLSKPRKTTTPKEKAS